MAALLQSYVNGQWCTAPDDGVALADAATGEMVARFSTQGLDFAAVVDHGRHVGGPALRELTFHRAGRAGSSRSASG